MIFPHLLAFLYGETVHLFPPPPFILFFGQTLQLKLFPYYIANFYEKKCFGHNLSQFKVMHFLGEIWFHKMVAWEMLRLFASLLQLEDTSRYAGFILAPEEGNS